MTILGVPAVGNFYRCEYRIMGKFISLTYGFSGLVMFYFTLGLGDSTISSAFGYIQIITHMIVKIVNRMIFNCVYNCLYVSGACLGLLGPFMCLFVHSQV